MKKIREILFRIQCLYQNNQITAEQKDLIVQTLKGEMRTGDLRQTKKIIESLEFQITNFKMFEELKKIL